MFWWVMSSLVLCVNVYGISCMVDCEGSLSVLMLVVGVCVVMVCCLLLVIIVWCVVVVVV